MYLTAPQTSKRRILYIYSTNIDTEYFKHALNSPFFSLQNAVCFIMLTCLVPVLFTFYIQDVLKLKKNNNSGAKSLNIKFPSVGHEYRNPSSCFTSLTTRCTFLCVQCLYYNWDLMLDLPPPNPSKLKQDV